MDIHLEGYRHRERIYLTVAGSLLGIEYLDLVPNAEVVAHQLEVDRRNTDLLQRIGLVVVVERNLLQTQIACITLKL